MRTCNKTSLKQEIIDQSREFYKQLDKSCYAVASEPRERRAYPYLVRLIADHQLQEKKCLEVGSGTGIFQDLVPDYTGLDVARSLGPCYHKPFFLVNDDGSYPFADDSFEAIWSYAVHEHIPNLQQALLEIKRILKPGGVLFFWPAWFCSTWAADGYAVRPYRDFGLKGKVIKALIPIRGSVLWRSLFIFPKRIWRHFRFLLGRRYAEILYKPLQANYQKFWVSDSDACNSIDPHDAILWFASHGFACVSHPTHCKAFLVRHEPLIFRKLTSGSKEQEA